MKELRTETLVKRSALTCAVMSGIIAVLSILVDSTFAAVVPLSRMGEPFYSKTLQIEWAVATNSLPATVMIFKVVPASFSPAVVSNLVRLGAFTATDRVQSLVPEIHNPKGVLSFQSSDKRSSLSIFPSYGFASFSSEGDFTAASENVPSQTRAFELGTNVLKQLELPAGQLETSGDQQPRAWFSPGTRGRGDKQTHKLVKQPWSMGIEFRRELEQIPCDDEHLRIRFESRERTASLELCWHGVQPLKRCSVATKKQIITWITEGRAHVGYSVMTGARWIKMSDIKRLTIKKITLHYSTASFSSDQGDDVLADRLYPYGEFEVEAELGPGDTECFQLLCPITREGLNRGSHKGGEFGVFPSALYEKQMHEEKNGQPN